MQNNQTLNPQSPQPSPSKDVASSPSARSFGTVEDFEFSSDESLLKVPSLNTLPEAVVAMPRKRSNALVQPLSPQDDLSEQEFNHSRNISLSSRKTRYSTVTDFDSECTPSLLFHRLESGEFDFCHQPDNKFSDLMDSEGNILDVHSDWEDIPVLERSDFGEEQESNSMYSMGDTVTNRSMLKSDDIDGLAVSSGQSTVPHHNPGNSPKMVKSTQEYETDNEENISSPDCVEPISYVPLYEKNQPVEEKFSEVSTPERQLGMDLKTKSNWIPVRKLHPFKTKCKKKKNSDGILSNHKKKAVTIHRRTQSESWRTSQVGFKLPKMGSLTLPNLQFCSPISPEDKRNDSCIIM